jgi:hypothetical protein
VGDVTGEVNVAIPLFSEAGTPTWTPLSYRVTVPVGGAQEDDGAEATVTVKVTGC